MLYRRYSYHSIGLAQWFAFGCLYNSACDSGWLAEDQKWKDDSVEPKKGASTVDFDRLALDSFDYNAVVARVSFELQYDQLKPFIEYEAEYAMLTKGPKVDFSDNRHKASLGLRYTPFDTFAVYAGTDIGLFGPDSGSLVGIPRNPAYNVFAGITFQAVGTELGQNYGRLMGSVTDSETGLAMDDVKVKLVGAKTSREKTKYDGSFELASVLDGVYQISFEKDGYESVTRSVRMYNGQTYVLSPKLSPYSAQTGNLELKVLDVETNKPLKLARVTIGGIAQSYSTNDKGIIKVSDYLVVGRYKVKVESEGFQPKELRVDISRKATSSKTVALSKRPPHTGLCKGIVKGEDKAPLTAIFIPDRRDVNPFVSNPRTGAWEVELEPGTYGFSVKSEGYDTKKILCSVKAGKTKDFKLALARTLEVEVVKIRSKPGERPVAIVDDELWGCKEGTLVKPRIFIGLSHCGGEEPQISVLEENNGYQ